MATAPAGSVRGGRGTRGAPGGHAVWGWGWGGFRGGGRGVSGLRPAGSAAAWPAGTRPGPRRSGGGGAEQRDERKQPERARQAGVAALNLTHPRWLPSVPPALFFPRGLF